MDELGGVYLQKAYIQIEKISLEPEKNNMAAAAGRILGGKSVIGTPQSTTYQFTVPFNPSELQISSQGGMVAKKTNLQKQEENDQGETYVYETVKSRKSLSVKLIFDNGENAPAGVTRMVEGFLAAVRSPASRNISFGWNKFVFSGSLENVSAEYTMFSSHGIPQRAEVTLSITGK